MISYTVQSQILRHVVAANDLREESSGVDYHHDLQDALPFVPAQHRLARGPLPHLSCDNRRVPRNPPLRWYWTPAEPLFSGLDQGSEGYPPSTQAIIVVSLHLGSQTGSGARYLVKVTELLWNSTGLSSRHCSAVQMPQLSRSRRRWRRMGMSSMRGSADG